MGTSSAPGVRFHGGRTVRASGATNPIPSGEPAKARYCVQGGARLSLLFKRGRVYYKPAPFFRVPF